MTAFAISCTPSSFPLFARVPLDCLKGINTSSTSPFDSTSIILDLTSFENPSFFEMYAIAFSTAATSSFIRVHSSKALRTLISSRPPLSSFLYLTTNGTVQPEVKSAKVFSIWSVVASIWKRRDETYNRWGKNALRHARARMRLRKAPQSASVTEPIVPKIVLENFLLKQDCFSRPKEPRHRRGSEKNARPFSSV